MASDRHSSAVSARLRRLAAGLIAAALVGAGTLATAPAATAAADPADKPKIVVVATGGTLAGKAAGRDTYTNYRAGTYPMSDMVAVLQPEV